MIQGHKKSRRQFCRLDFFLQEAVIRIVTECGVLLPGVAEVIQIAPRKHHISQKLEYVIGDVIWEALRNWLSFHSRIASPKANSVLKFLFP